MDENSKDISITESFDSDLIAYTNSELTHDQESELIATLEGMARANETEITESETNLAIYAFVAGRTYQSQFNSTQTKVNIEMDETTLNAFLAFLTSKEK